VKGLTEQCSERPPGDFVPQSDPGRKEEADAGSERDEVDRRDVISRVMNEMTDETSEKASGGCGGDGRFATFRSVAYVPLLSTLLANRDDRKTKSRATCPIAITVNKSKSQEIQDRSKLRTRFFSIPRIVLTFF